MQVKRALTLTINSNYDFELNKLILKPDHSHPSRKPTTAMFAFSETVWEPRTMLYLEKSISKLKEKDWKKILEAASEYSNIPKSQKSVALLKGKGREVITKEEMELAWDSDSN
jgi:lipopolysaccharide biosynthesis glycosyltransferase